MSRRKTSSLGRIVNMVTSTTDAYTEVFIASEGGEFAKFTVPLGLMREQGRGLGCEELSLAEFLEQTQHYLGDERISADYGSRRVEDGV